MDCRSVIEHLDSGGPGEPAAELREHLAHCAACRKAWEAGRVTAHTLKALPLAPVPAGFAERVLANAYRQAERMDGRRRQLRDWGLALAATFVLGLGVGLAFTWNAGDRADGYRTLADGTLLLTPGDRTTVRIALDAERPIGNVDFVIDLPAGMELAGHPGEREVAWNGELKQGRNVLGLPLIAQAGASGELTTKLRHDAHDSVFKLHVMAAGGPAWWAALRRLWT
ncbi:MAG: hypothetical protein ACM3ZT_07805 [Bacillota bacterium]